MANRAVGALAAVAAGLAGWGLYESQWLSTRTLEVPVRGLPRALDGLGVLHLSDFHAGAPAMNMRTLRRAVDFGVRMHPDLVAVTGDLVNHPRAIPSVARELARLGPPLGMYAVTGNHDVRETIDPLSRGVVVEDWRPAAMELLRDRMVEVERDGVRIQVAGADADVSVPRARPESLFQGTDAFRILLAHFPDVAADLPQGSCSLVLSGHLHGGQICLPGPRGKIRFGHARNEFDEGVFLRGEMTVVVSRGTGTTLLPFRVLARPEACLLRLRPG
ncbi:MAG: metallophosphoesterase [Gaiellales bacterium]